MTNYYGYFVGTVSKAVYPIPYLGYISLVVVAKCAMLNFVISPYITYSQNYQYPYTNGKFNKFKMLFNLNTEFDSIKQVSLWMSIGATFFGGTFKITHLQAVKYAQQMERYIEEDVLCLSGVLCEGDQYGLFDLVYDILDFSGAENNKAQECLFNCGE